MVMSRKSSIASLQGACVMGIEGQRLEASSRLPKVMEAVKGRYVAGMAWWAPHEVECAPVGPAERALTPPRSTGMWLRRRFGRMLDTSLSTSRLHTTSGSIHQPRGVHRDSFRDLQFFHRHGVVTTTPHQTWCGEADSAREGTILTNCLF